MNCPKRPPVRSSVSSCADVLWDTSAEVLWLENHSARLEVRCWGPPPSEAATIVLLHEGLGCVGLWRDFPARLAEATGLGVLAYSRRGYGRSSICDLPRKPDYMHVEAEGDLPWVLAAFGIKRVILVGHSDGASIATIYMGSEQQSIIEAGALIAPHFFVEDVGLESIEQAFSSFRTTDLRDRLARHHDNPDAAFLGWSGAWLDPDFASWDITDRLGALRAPILAIQGDEDQYGTQAQLTCLRENCVSPVDIALIPGCKHAPHAEKPDEVLSLIANFLRRVHA